MTSVVQLQSAVAVAGRFPALAGVDFDAERGEVVAIFGPNGAGKTSLLRLLAGLMPLVDGSGSVFGRDLVKTREQLSGLVGFLGHSSYFYDELSGIDNLTFFLKALHLDVGGVKDALSRCGISGRLQTSPLGKLSQGQKKRVGLAYLVARKPDLWLLDEPHTSLDEAGRQLLDQVVYEAKENRACVIFSSHEEVAALSMATRNVKMRGGVISDDRPSQMIQPLSLLETGDDQHVA